MRKKKEFDLNNRFIFAQKTFRQIQNAAAKLPERKAF